MSFSTSWVDSLVFAMAPLGVITAIVGMLLSSPNLTCSFNSVGAIRVGGPSWLRGLIGRARETRAAAEVELMSSTSHEVCEIWNGDAVVRVMGSPQIQQLLYFEDLPEENIFEKIRGEKTAEAVAAEPEPEANSPNTTQRESAKRPKPVATVSSPEDDLMDKFKRRFPIFTLEEAVKMGIVHRRAREETQWGQWLIWVTAILNKIVLFCVHNNHEATEPQKNGDEENRQDYEPMTNESSKEEAPNISMNLSKQKKSWELYLAAVVGVIFQAAVVGVAIGSSYSPRLQFNKSSITVQGHSYGECSPSSQIEHFLQMSTETLMTLIALASIGTLLLVTGMFIAASVVEQSTHEETYEKHPLMAETKLFIVW